MNIIHIGNFGRGWDNSICDELHISEALGELGHTVVNVQREEWREKTFEGAGGKWHPFPNFILLAQWDGFTKDFIPIIKDIYSGVPIVFWCYDYQADGQEWHERLVKESDLYLSKRIADSKYPNWQWLSQDFAPKFLDKYQQPISVSDYEQDNRIKKDIDVLFTGSYLPWATARIEVLKAIDQRFNLTIHSVTPDQWKAEGLKNVYGPVMDGSLPELIARAKINLAIDHTLENGYWSDRAAQIMACGGFVLQKYVPLMESVFRQKTGYFYEIEDCLQKIDSFLKLPPEDMELMANIGYEYAHQELMVTNRVSDLLTIVESTL